MGQTVHKLSTKTFTTAPIFSERFVVEICEEVHTHYRHLRIRQSLPDWVAMAEGMRDALARWETRGRPAPGQGIHIELCRKVVAQQPYDPQLLAVHLNRNLYPQYAGQIFAAGAHCDEPIYIHLKVRDLRLELTLDEFQLMAEAIHEAQQQLAERGDSRAMLSTT